MASVERTVRRRMLTILCKNFEEKNRDDFDIDELTTAYTQVETEAQRVFDLDEKVQRQLLEAETSEDVLMEEFTRVQEYRGKLYLVQAKYDRLTKQQNEDALDILRAWGRHQSLSSEATSSTGTDLEALMQFIKAEVESDERIQLATSFTLGEYKEKPISKANKLDKFKEPKVEESPTAANILSLDDKSSYRTSCIFCDKEHQSQDCLKAQSWPLSERKDLVTRKRACFCCLRKNHRAQDCRARVKCVVCSRKHYPILCPGKVDQKGGQEEKNASLAVANNTPNPILLQTLLVKIKSRRGMVTARVLLDSGSQRSYILASLVQELGLKKVGDEVLTHNLFGGLEATRVNHGLYKLAISDLGDNHKLDVRLLDQNKICSSVPRLADMSFLSELKRKGIELSDVGPNAPKIGILLGVDVIGKILTGQIERTETGLVLQKTLLGWTAFGESPNFIHSDFCLANLSVSDMWELETIGIRESGECKIQSSGEVLAEFEKSVRVNDEGRYEVKLPWKIENARIQSNFGIAKSRLISTTNRLIKLGKYEEDERVFGEWLAEGIIEEVADSMVALMWILKNDRWNPFNPEEPQPITPLQFIQDIDVDEVPDLDDIDSRRLGSRLRWRFQSRHCENCGKDLHETVTAIVPPRDIDLGGRRYVSQYSTAGVNPATSHHQIWTPGHTPEQIPGLLFRLGGCCV
ncbi:hypothetical protein GE061_012601 [Apolygus lucorum]|uniref:Peptidase aspartic putative domain-containing protein n=1 Tax=Apolygus lucorum TaxID=248454 RepID=A0A8S9XUU0_APOLU|nr:hypothetical protein GE061_012601 [Apolygus lucorum]